MKKLFTVVLLTVFCWANPNPINGYQISDPSPADKITRLVPYPFPDNGPDQRTPLILIHGIHASEDFNKNGILDEWEAVEQLSGFKNFLNYYNTNEDLKSAFKIYRFLYLSDKQSVWEIARSLRNHLDEAIANNQIKDGEFVILVHSMGGLIARSYMYEHSHYVGKYAGQRGGQRIVRLITLATPHHGSIVANHQSRNQLATNADLRDAEYQNAWNAETIGNTWRNLIKVASFFFWTKFWDIDRINYSEPNRSDLLWDNFDGISDPTNEDQNQWLQKLNRENFYDDRITAYSGVISVQDPLYVQTINLVYTAIGGPMVLATKSVTASDHERLIYASIALNYGLYKNYRPFELNDGLVPKSSAAFGAHIINRRVSCLGYNHLDMIQGGTMPCEDGLNLFDSIQQELMSLALRPKIIGSLTTKRLSDLGIYGQYIFAEASEDPMYVIDIADPTNPILKKKFGAKPDSLSTHLIVKNRLLFAVGRNESFSVYDINAPESPTLISRLPQNNWFYANAMAVGENNILVVSISNWKDLNLIDITNPYNPWWMTKFDEGDGYNRILIYRNLLIGVTSVNYLKILDIADPFRPFRLGSQKLGQWAKGLFENQGYIYVYYCELSCPYGCPTKGSIEIYDIRNPASITLVGKINTQSCIQCLSVKNNLILAGQDNGLNIINASNFSALKELALTPLPPIYGIVVKDDLVFLGHYYGLAVVKLTGSN